MGWVSVYVQKMIKSTDFKEKIFVLEFCSFSNRQDVGKGRKLLIPTVLTSAFHLTDLED